MPWLSDKQVLAKRYYLRFNRKLNLDNPTTFNEKMQWLKLYNRQPSYSMLVDKATAKDIVSKRIGSKYIIPTIGLYNNVREIDFNSFPDSFAIKCTHDSGSVILCKDKSRFKYLACKKAIKKKLSHNYYWGGREWPYKNVKPRIIVEPLIQDKLGHDLISYKFFCFDGKPYLIQVIQNDKKPNETVDYYDVQWKRLNLKQNYPNSGETICRPKSLNNMINIAKELSCGFPFIRIDLFCIDEDVFFSEFCFFSDDGDSPFFPDEWDYILGELITLKRQS